MRGKSTQKYGISYLETGATALAEAIGANLAKDEAAKLTGTALEVGTTELSFLADVVEQRAALAAVCLMSNNG